MLDRIGKGTREGSLFFSREVAYKKNSFIQSLAVILRYINRNTYR